MSGIAGRRGSPRLVVKVLGFSFAVTAAVLAAVFLVLSWQIHDRISRAVVSNQEASQRRFAELTSRRQREQRLQAAALAENPTLKAAVDTYQAEHVTHGDSADQLVGTIRLELAKLQRTFDVPALTVTDARGVILTSTGPLSADWPAGDRVPAGLDATADSAEAVIARGTRPYLVTIVPLTFRDDVIGGFLIASPLDDRYARELASEAGTGIAIIAGGRLVASSAAFGAPRAVEAIAPRENGSVEIGGDEFVFGRLWTVDAASVYALESVTGPVRAATTEAGWVLLGIGAGALLLAGLGSWWLARTLSAPIQGLTHTLAQMASERDFERPLALRGSSRELDDLIATFDELRAAVAAAENESEAAYVGVIGSLAAALDARDAYTAGHSERVANLSVAIARQLDLPEHDIETLRLGAVLHDIGKIGVSDSVLRKPGSLTDDEFAQIKQHPGLGARILKPLRFLAAHLLIVELHHERPDGRGYPHGLKESQIPLLASIVHVADAYDAITSARAYRPSRPVAEAMAELRKHAGTDFVSRVVDALEALPASVLIRSQEAAAQATLSDEGASVRGALIRFRARAAANARGRHAAG